MTIKKTFSSKANSKQEKLIFELSDNLKDASGAFINLNRLSYSAHEMFSALFNGTMAFVGMQMMCLCELLDEKWQKEEFLRDIEDLFKRYHDQVKNNIM